MSTIDTMILLCSINSNDLGTVFTAKGCASAQKPYAMAGRIGVGGCGLVGRLIAGCVGWCMGCWPNHHQHFDTRQRKTFLVDGWAGGGATLPPLPPPGWVTAGSRACSSEDS